MILRASEQETAIIRIYKIWNTVDKKKQLIEKTIDKKQLIMVKCYSYFLEKGFSPNNQKMIGIKKDLLSNRGYKCLFVTLLLLFLHEETYNTRLFLR